MIKMVMRIWGEQIREERFLNRFMKKIEEKIGFSKDFLNIHPLNMFNKTRIFCSCFGQNIMRQATLSDYTGMVSKCTQDLVIE